MTRHFTESKGLAEALHALAARKGKPTLKDRPTDVSTFPMTQAAREALRLGPRKDH